MNLRAIAFFAAPALLLPLLVGVGSKLALRAPAPAALLAADPGADAAPGIAAAVEEAVIGRPIEYVPLRIPLDVTLPRDLGRVRVNLAVAIDASDPATSDENWTARLEAAQRGFAEVALRVAERRDAGPGLDPDLTLYRQELPRALRVEMNRQLGLLEPPREILEVLIMDWGHARGDARSSTPLDTL
ncbi:MAG: hypothetical protein AAFQ54_08125 [Pseudomonadota bacterium]